MSLPNPSKLIIYYSDSSQGAGATPRPPRSTISQNYHSRYMSGTS